MVLTSRTRVLLYVAFKEAAFSALSENEVVFSATGITAASCRITQGFGGRSSWLLLAEAVPVFFSSLHQTLRLWK